MKIFLCGFMGAGKTTLFNLWKEQIDQNSEKIDLDDYLFQKHGTERSSLAALIQEKGWDVFRNWESLALANIVKQKCSSLVALGGGSLNVSTIKLFEEPDSKLIWIKTPIEICWDRVKNDSNRPLVKQGEDEFKKLYKKRVELYQRASIIIDGEDTFPNFKELFQS